MIKAIIFDFDGVIEDNYEAHFGLSKKKIKDLTREEHKKLFEGNIHEQREKLGERLSNFDLMGCFSNMKSTLKIKEEVKEFIVKLSKKYLLGVITSGYEAGVNVYLKNNNLESFFDFVYGFETDKNKDKKFKLFFNERCFGKGEVIFITDTLGDLLEANKVGIKTIAIDFGFHEAWRLKKGEPWKIVSSFKELEGIFLTL
jgi:phosphoglycolate phosphatase